MSSTVFNGTWGAFDNAGTNGIRVGIDYDWSTVTSTSTSATLTVWIWTQNKFAYDDEQLLTYSGGTISGTTRFQNNTGATTGTTNDLPRFRATKTYTWNYTNYRDSPSTRTLTASLSEVTGGPTPTHTRTTAVPARPGVTPGQPGATSSPGDGSVSIGYSAPAELGTPNITDYQHSTDGVNFYSNPSNPFPITGLANGTAYSVYVRATNGYYNSTSALVTSTPRTTPGAPTSLSRTENNGSITVSYVDATVTGGESIDRHEYSTNAGSSWTTSTSPFTVNGTNGTAITVYIRAVNDAGGGTQASISGTPRTVPGAPTVSATPSNNALSISYGAPASNGGSNITSYEYSTDNVNYTATTSNPFSVSGTNGTAKTVYVRAVNAAGNSAAGSATGTPRTTPSAPTSFAGSNTTFGQINLSWAAPSSNGGNAVTSYVLRNGTTVLQNSASTSYSHVSLSPNTSYSYTVTAVNGAGEGTAASVTTTSLGGLSRVWNGSAWVVVLPQVWNGSAWVTAQARIWTGLEWKHAI